MRYFKEVFLAASLFFTNVAMADLVSPDQGPAFPRCDGLPEGSHWPDRWNITINSGDTADKTDYVNLLKVMGTRGFKIDGVMNLGTEVAYVYLAFDKQYFVGNPSKAEQVLNNGLQTLASSNGISINCSPIYSPAPALTVRN